MDLIDFINSVFFTPICVLNMKLQTVNSVFFQLKNKNKKSPRQMFTSVDKKDQSGQ